MVVDITTAADNAWVYVWFALGLNTASAVSATGWSDPSNVCNANDGTSARYALLRRQKQSGDTTFTFSWGGTSTKGVAQWVSYTGLDNTTPDELANLTVRGASGHTTVPTASITPNAADRWIAVFFAVRTSTSGNKAISWTPDAATVERADTNNSAAASAAWMGIEAADTNGVVTQAAHSYTATHNFTETHDAAAILALIPASGSTLSIAGAATSTSSTTGAIGFLLDLAGSAASTSSTAGAVTSLLGLAGAATSTSSTTGAVTATLALSGAATSTSSTTGAITATLALTGAATSTSSTTGAVTATLAIAGTAAASTSSTTGAITERMAIAGAATSSSSTTGAITATLAIAGAASSTSATVGALGTLPIAGTVTSSSATTGAITATLVLTGAAASTSAAAGTLTARLALAGAVVSVSVAAGQLTLTVALPGGSALSISTTHGAVTIGAQLTRGLRDVDGGVPGGLAGVSDADGSSRLAEGSSGTSTIDGGGRGAGLDGGGGIRGLVG